LLNNNYFPSTFKKSRQIGGIFLFLHQHILIAILYEN